jgi:hypothetical protein
MSCVAVESGRLSWYSKIINCAAAIEQLKQMRETLDKLIELLEAGESDQLVKPSLHLREYRRTCERTSKGNLIDAASQHSGTSSHLYKLSVAGV